MLEVGSKQGHLCSLVEAESTTIAFVVSFPSCWTKSIHPRGLFYSTQRLEAYRVTFSGHVLIPIELSTLLSFSLD